MADAVDPRQKIREELARFSLQETPLIFYVSDELLMDPVALDAFIQSVSAEEFEFEDDDSWGL